jgi:Protein of unknown function with PCYCGC motif
MPKLPSWLAVTFATILLGAMAGGFGLWFPRQFNAGPAEALNLASLPPEVAGHYHFVEAHTEMASQIPCYCGCGGSLGHRSLRDCYLARTGSGYSDHAAYCMVCDRIAADAQQMFTAGDAVPAIRAAIDTKYGQLGPGTNTPLGS